MSKTIKEFLIENHMEHLWSDKNEDSMLNYTIGSHKKIWIKCDKTNYHDDYEVACQNLTILRSGCPYCNSNSGKVHILDSFGQYLLDEFGKYGINKYWSNKNTVDPFKITKHNSKKVWIKCQEKDYHGDYEISCAHFMEGKRCPYCSSRKVHWLDSFGKYMSDTNQYDVINNWSDKNKKTPYEYSIGSKVKVWWKCGCGKHVDYKRDIYASFVRKFICPNCSNERNESFLQEKIRLYLSDVAGYKLNHEYNCGIVPYNPKNKHGMPFDNEVIDLKLIIEVHGQQHYLEYASSSNRVRTYTPEEELHKRQLYDRYKSYVAYKNGYNYIAIPYWTDNAEEEWKQMLNNKINEIKV